MFGRQRIIATRIPLALRRGVASTRATPPTPQRTLQRRLLQGAAIGLVAGMFWGFWAKHTDKQLGQVRSDDLLTLQPPTSCEAFPVKLNIKGKQFRALGVGAKTVTFLKFHVYGCGLYIAEDDVPTASKVLTSGLSGPGIDGSVLDELLRQNVHFALRIMPVRNTDFSHLRDGFVRAVVHHPLFKEVGQSAEFADSMGELKRAFGRKAKVPKGDVLTFVGDASGGMTVYYCQGDSQDVYEPMGQIKSADLSRIFFLNYLGTPRPLSPTLTESVNQGLVTLATV